MMGGYGGMLLGGLMMVVFWVLVIGGGVWLVVTLTRGTSTGAQRAAGQPPLDILKARYAKGEITKEQFDQMKRDLGV